MAADGDRPERPDLNGCLKIMINITDCDTGRQIRHTILQSKVALEMTHEETVHKFLKMQVSQIFYDLLKEITTKRGG